VDHAVNPVSVSSGLSPLVQRPGGGSPAGVDGHASDPAFAQCLDSLLHPDVSATPMLRPGSTIDPDPSAAGDRASAAATCGSGANGLPSAPVSGAPGVTASAGPAGSAAAPASIAAPAING